MPVGHLPGRAAAVRLSVAFHERLSASIDGRRGETAANLLCEACVELFGVDAAAISLVFDGANVGTLGHSGGPARAYDELQFTIGEGPCLDSVSNRRPVLAVDLADRREVRWPLYGPAMLDMSIRGVFAMPIVVAGEYIGALDLFRSDPGHLSDEELAGAMLAGEMAALPMLDLMHGNLVDAVTDPNTDAWAELNALTRVEVSQATGMLVAQLGVEPAEALIRLRAHAYSTNRSATEVARDILDRRMRFEIDRTGDQGD